MRPELEHEGQDAKDDAFAETVDQCLDARLDLSRPASDFKEFPFRSLATLVGNVAPADVWFVAGFSGNGKTTLAISLCDALLRLGDVVYYMGLESRPKTIRTMFACHRLGYHSGDILSGEPVKRQWPEWPAMRSELLAELDRQMKLDTSRQLLVNPRKRIDALGLKEACREAALSGASWMVIDHIDHITYDGRGSLYEESVRITNDTLEHAHHYGLRILALTQTNNDAVRGDRLAVYGPPQPHHVKMGGHKREIAHGMLGIFRPLRSDVTREEQMAVREGRAEPQTVLVPNTMGVVCMKHRYYGSREGQRCMLHVSRGRVSEPVLNSREGD